MIQNNVFLTVRENVWESLLTRALSKGSCEIENINSFTGGGVVMY